MESAESRGHPSSFESDETRDDQNARERKGIFFFYQTRQIDRTIRSSDGHVTDGSSNTSKSLQPFFYQRTQSSHPLPVKRRCLRCRSSRQSSRRYKSGIYYPYVAFDLVFGDLIEHSSTWNCPEKVPLLSMTLNERTLYKTLCPDLELSSSSQLISCSLVDQFLQLVDHLAQMKDSSQTDRVFGRLPIDLQSGSIREIDLLHSTITTKYRSSSFSPLSIESTSLFFEVQQLSFHPWSIDQNSQASTFFRRRKRNFAQLSFLLRSRRRFVSSSWIYPRSVVICSWISAFILTFYPQRTSFSTSMIFANLSLPLLISSCLSFIRNRNPRSITI